MNRYEIRTNCEYVIEILAQDEREALDIAEDIPLRDWVQAWAPNEIELISEETEDE